MKLTILGSGSPEAHVRRASSGYLLEIGNDRILFDCGGGVFDNLLRCGFQPSDITHLVFSHLHSDHMMDYARLVHAAWDEGGQPLQVFGPQPIAAINDGYFGAKGVFSHDLKARTELEPSKAVWVARGGTLPRPWPAPEITEIEPGFCLEQPDWRLTSCEVPHAQPALECMAFRIDAGGKSFVYSGDSGHSDVLEELATGCDLLLHWCYRLDGQDRHPAMRDLTPTPSEIGAMAERAGVKRLILTHFRKHMDTEVGHRSARENLDAAFSGDAAIAEDRQSFTI